jgi:hypothetical protein
MSGKDDWHPCNREQGLCQKIRELVRFPGEVETGLFVVMTMENDYKESEIQGIMYKEDKEAKGLMLNFCPICGAKIDWFREDGLEVKELQEK